MCLSFNNNHLQVGDARGVSGTEIAKYPRPKKEIVT